MGNELESQFTRMLCYVIIIMSSSNGSIQIKSPLQYTYIYIVYRADILYRSYT